MEEVTVPVVVQALAMGVEALAATVQEVVQEAVMAQESPKEPARVMVPVMAWEKVLAVEVVTVLVWEKA